MFDDYLVQEADEKFGRILLVDDEPAVLQALKRLLYRQYQVETASSGHDALAKLSEEPFDLIISDMRMPGMSGADLLAICFERWPDMTRVLITGYSDLESAVKAVNDGNIFRYVNKPWNNEQLRGIVADALQRNLLKDLNEKLQARVIEQNEELARLNRELEKKFLQKSDQAGEAEAKLEGAYRTLVQEFKSMLHMLVSLVERRNGEEPGSSERLARLAKLFGEFAGLVGEQVQDLYYAALLKNIGKITLPDSVLVKSLTVMTPAEKKEYARFTINGQTTLMLLEPLQNAANIIRSHMELYNGKGFPDRLAMDAIPREARLLRIVTDYVDLQREYNFLGERLNEEASKAYLLKMAGQRYDRELVDIFMEVLEDFDEGVVSNMDRIPIAEVRVGMTLATNLISPAGVVLLSEGTQLNDRHVTKLQAMARQFAGHQILLHVRQNRDE
ncbi:HD domain-containing phosphohydrolase [Parathalassolituus penaei]|uniref:Response regulator n=1 Tax=Parathalassolituus penaei TaxID=2997323 RepID=A0A9X3EGE7_9GAMM|nr:HD domain-containing phosphohydrolase [Parathalassolituus penaei]MCY0966265.1 response regulator [Parathalassolituus penaei]